MDVIDIIGRTLFIGDTVVFSRPKHSSTVVDIGTIVKYNSRTGFISLEPLWFGGYSWSNKVISTKFDPKKFYRVDKQL